MKLSSRVIKEGDRYKYNFDLYNINYDKNQIEKESKRKHKEFDYTKGYIELIAQVEEAEKSIHSTEEKGAAKPTTTDNPVPEVEAAEQDEPTKLENVSFYGLFLLKIQTLCQQQALGIDELISATDLHKGQLTIWLKQAVEEGKVNKLNRPVRYQWAENKQQELLN